MIKLGLILSAGGPKLIRERGQWNSLLTEFIGPFFSPTVSSFIFPRYCAAPLNSQDLLTLGGPVMGVQGPFHIGRYSRVSWQKWARFPVRRQEGPCFSQNVLITMFQLQRVIYDVLIAILITTF